MEDIQALVVYGQQGKTVEVRGASVCIVKKGWIFGTRREKVYPIPNITSVQVKKPGIFFSGYIQFSIGGGIERETSFSTSGGTVAALQDENSVVFTGRDNYESALQIAKHIESYTRRDFHPATSLSVADEILKLKGLFDSGVITAQQFESKKIELLNQK